MALPKLETIARESLSDIAVTKTYQLKMKETIAVIKRFDAGSSACSFAFKSTTNDGKENKKIIWILS